jgi:hypothetical protein
MNNPPNTYALNGHVASFATFSMDFSYCFKEMVCVCVFFFFLNNAPNTSALNEHVTSFATSSMDFSYCFKEMFFFLQVVDSN